MLAGRQRWETRYQRTGQKQLEVNIALQERIMSSSSGRRDRADDAIAHDGKSTHKHTAKTKNSSGKDMIDQNSSGKDDEQEASTKKDGETKLDVPTEPPTMKTKMFLLMQCRI
jgi:hypothetical protein